MMTLTPLIFVIYFGANVVKAATLHQTNHAQAQPSSEALFRDFMVSNQRNYANEEETAKRFTIFERNLAYIKSLNAMHSHTVFGITRFADYTPEELQEAVMSTPPAQYLDDQMILDGRMVPYKEYASSAVPSSIIPSSTIPSAITSSSPSSSFDWRDDGKITPVKNQGRCSSCWAFAAASVVEAMYAIKHNVSTDLSEQQLMDCDKLSNGCTTGQPNSAYRVAQSQGLLTEDQYPYQAKQNDTCPPKKGGVFVKSIISIAPVADTIVQFVYKHGPVSTYFKVVPSLGLYMSGIYQPNKTECETPLGIHTVAIVGFGEIDNQKYWIIKSSWGPNWGEGGYMRFGRGENACDVEAYPYSVSVV